MISPMKYVVCVPDGCADEPLDELGGRTPLEVAHLPTLRRARGARRGRPGRGDPRRHAAGQRRRQHGDLRLRPRHVPHRPGTHRGRRAGPASCAADQVAYRCNLVTVGADDTMVDFAGGHPTTEDAAKVIEALAGRARAATASSSTPASSTATSWWRRRLGRRRLHAAPRPLRQAGRLADGPAAPRAAAAHGASRPSSAASTSRPTRSGCGARASSRRCRASRSQLRRSTPRSAPPSTSCAASGCSPTSRSSTSRA